MITLREASYEDCELIRAMAQKSFPATYASILTREQISYMMEMMYSADAVRCQFDDGHRYFIAFYDGEPCGYVSIQQQGADLFHLHKIYVVPEFQGRKVGGTLFDEAVKRVKEMHPGHCRIELNVNRFNKALGFYEHKGMRRLREGDFPIGNGYFMNDYIMGLEI